MLLCALQAARRTAKEQQADVLTGIAIGNDWEAQHRAAMQSTARALASGLASPALSGRVGDCCDEEADVRRPSQLLSIHLHNTSPVKHSLQFLGERAILLCICVLCWRLIHQIVAVILRIASGF